MNFKQLFSKETAHVIVSVDRVFFYPEKKSGYHAAAVIVNEDIPDIVAECKKRGLIPSTIFRWKVTPTHFGYSVPGKLWWNNFPHEMHYSEDEGVSWRWIMGHFDAETGFIVVDEELGPVKPA